MNSIVQSFQKFFASLFCPIPVPVGTSSNSPLGQPYVNRLHNLCSTNQHVGIGFLSFYGCPVIILSRRGSLLRRKHKGMKKKRRKKQRNEVKRTT